MRKINSFFAARSGYANVLLRIVAAWRCVLPAWLFISGAKPMDKFVGLLTSLHFPVPTACAYISIYTQFICGLLFLLGLWTRPAALLSTVHFLIIIAAVDIHNNIITSFTAWALLAMSVTLLSAGAEKMSLDGLYRHK
jgi:uncharacterized membrane protein YphA (DoxX/SURF4 family)